MDKIGFFTTHLLYYCIELLCTVQYGAAHCHYFSHNGAHFFFFFFLSMLLLHLFHKDILHFWSPQIIAEIHYLLELYKRKYFAFMPLDIMFKTLHTSYKLPPPLSDTCRVPSPQSRKILHR